MANPNQSAHALLLVEVTDEPLQTFAARQNKDTGMMMPGRSKQSCYLHSDARYPVPFKLDVPADARPYVPGFYCLAGSAAFKAAEWDGLQFRARELLLVPISDAIAQLTEKLGQRPKIAAAS